jgi:hypothetical protein
MKPYDSSQFWKLEDPLHTSDFEKFLMEETEAIAKAATSDLKTHHLDYTIHVLDGIRTSGLDTYHGLEGKGEPPVDVEPFWETIRILEERMRNLILTREGLALFTDTVLPPAPTTAPPITDLSAASPPPGSPYYFVSEAASYCRCSESSIYHAAGTGTLHGSKFGEWRFIKEDLDEWIYLRNQNSGKKTPQPNKKSRDDIV